MLLLAVYLARSRIHHWILIACRAVSLHTNRTVVPANQILEIGFQQSFKVTICIQSLFGSARLISIYGYERSQEFLPKELNAKEERDSPNDRHPGRKLMLSGSGP